jgi:hypothetical protein
MTAMWGGSSRQKLFSPFMLRSAIVSLFSTDPGEQVSSLFQPRSVFQALTGCPSKAVPQNRCNVCAKTRWLTPIRPTLPPPTEPATVRSPWSPNPLGALRPCLFLDIFASACSPQRPPLV